MKRSKNIFLIAIILFYINTVVYAQPAVDVALQQNKNLIVKDANIIFPELLLENKEMSIDFIENFAKNKRGYLINMYKKGKNYFPKAAKILQKYNLPSEYKVLIAIESAFNPNDVSTAGAVGYWQIMDETAKEYGLKYLPQQITTENTKIAQIQKLKVSPINTTSKTIIEDERKNFVKSTHAAAHYLKDRSRNLKNNPLLVVASYNCGNGNVLKAIKKSGVANASFWDIKKYLPTETQNYVMNFIAMTVIFNNYNKFENNTLTFRPSIVKIQKNDISYETQERKLIASLK